MVAAAEDSTSADNSRPSFGVLGQQENKRRKVDDEMQSPTTGHQSRLFFHHCGHVTQLIYVSCTYKLCYVKARLLKPDGSKPTRSHGKGLAE
jgi:hypothetical protein